jgi:hypothetical protein
MKSSKRTMQKFSKAQICMSLSNHALCVLVPFVSWGSEMCSLGVPMSDSAVVGLFFASTKCTSTIHPPTPLTNFVFCFLLLAETYGREDGELAFQTFPGIFREEAIMLLRDFYMQENHNGIPTPLISLIAAPNPKLKTTRKKKLDFDPLVWSKYISEDKLLESVTKVYGCDPRDTEKYQSLEKAGDAKYAKDAKRSLTDKMANCAVS